MKLAQMIKKCIKKHNEKKLLKAGFIRCVNCNNLVNESDRYCMHCGRRLIE